jgi:hypothetical protein
VRPQSCNRKFRSPLTAKEDAKENQDQKHTAEDAEGGRVELDLLERSKICDKKHDFETLAVQRDQRRTEKNWFGAR